MKPYYKNYGNYPLSLTDGISAAKIGMDFYAVGNDRYTSTGTGRVYGMETYVQ